MRPLRNIVYARKLSPKEAVSEGGIVLPSNVDRREQQIQILACGPEADQCAAGELAIVSLYAGTEPDEDNRYLVSQDDIICVLETDP